MTQPDGARSVDEILEQCELMRIPSAPVNDPKQLVEADHFEDGRQRLGVERIASHVEIDFRDGADHGGQPARAVGLHSEDDAMLLVHTGDVGEDQFRIPGR